MPLNCTWAGVVLSVVFKLYSEPRRVLSCLFPVVLYGKFTSPGLDFCSHRVIGLFIFAYYKISTLYQSALSLELLHILFQTRSVPLENISKLSVRTDCLSP